jgi:hypothetical protein
MSTGEELKIAPVLKRAVAVFNDLRGMKAHYKSGLVRSAKQGLKEGTVLVCWTLKKGWGKEGRRGTHWVPEKEI